MQTWHVKLWPNGKWDGKPSQEVEAETPQEAAEKLYGKPLKATGSNFQMRAQVHRVLAPRGAPESFYEA